LDAAELNTCYQAVVRQNSAASLVFELSIQSILDSIKGEAAILDNNAVIRVVNESWRHFGLQNDIDPVMPALGADVGTQYLPTCGMVNSAVSTELSCGLCAVLDGRLPSFSLEYLGNVGQKTWFRTKVNPIGVLGQGGVIITHMDISFHKHKEFAQIEEGFFWKFAVEGSGDGVWDRNVQTGAIIYSKRWMTMLGYAEDDVPPTRQQWQDSIHPDDQVRVAALLQAYQDGISDIYVFECRLRCKDNSYKWIMSRGMAVTYDKDGKPLRIIGTHTDISARKQIEEILEEKERMLSESQRIAHIGSWSINTSTNILVWSEEMYAIHRISKEDFDHTPAGFIKLVHPDDRALINYSIKDNKTSDIKKEINFRIILSDGEVRYICATSEVQYNAEHDIQRIVGSAQDVTERKNQDLRNQAHLEQLAHVTRLGLMGEMASGIAHEVNQPLTAISTYTQVSLNLIKTEHPDLIKLDEVIAKTQVQALRAGKIIHRMKGFCKAKTQQRSTVDMRSLIEDCASLCADGLNANSVKLFLELQQDMPTIHIDQIQIEQVLINLIRNSIDALTSVMEQRQITIKSHLIPGNMLQVTVTDNGPGLDKEQQQKILTPFYTTKKDGMGMGLSISRSLVEAHGGLFKYTSEPGEGATFYFTLPTGLN
jgi:PAS domain S-box-containing protein